MKFIGREGLAPPALFGTMSLLAPSERGLPRKRVEEPAKQETVRLI